MSIENPLIKVTIRKFSGQSLSCWGETILTWCVLTTFGPLPCPNAESTGPRVPWPLSSYGSIPWPPCPPPPTPCPPPPLPVEMSRKQLQPKSRLLLLSMMWRCICEISNYNLIPPPQPCFESKMGEVWRELALGENNRLLAAVQIARGVRTDCTCQCTHSDRPGNPVCCNSIVTTIVTIVIIIFYADL